MPRGRARRLREKIRDFAGLQFSGRGTQKKLCVGAGGSRPLPPARLKKFLDVDQSRAKNFPPITIDAGPRKEFTETASVIRLGTGSQTNQ
jgi:hypothetical protein